MKKLIYAKCPYCGENFPWVHNLLGEYPITKTIEKCKKCNSKCEITVIETLKFVAKKTAQ